MFDVTVLAFYFYLSYPRRSITFFTPAEVKANIRTAIIAIIAIDATNAAAVAVVVTVAATADTDADAVGAVYALGHLIWYFV